MYVYYCRYNPMVVLRTSLFQLANLQCHALRFNSLIRNVTLFISTPCVTLLTLRFHVIELFQMINFFLRNLQIHML